jgi:arginine N-succinyltransferase
VFYVRPIARDDLPAVLALSERTGAGLTTLPANRDRLSERIGRSLASFDGGASRADACYVFVLVESASSKVVGIAAIEAAVGLKEPWYNYRVGTIVHASRALDVYTVAPTLFLANDHTGHTELCSLFLDQAHRHGRNGPLLAKSRLLFIAEFADRFATKVIAEMRGKLDADGKSPFWEGLGRHFFAMEYSTADYLTGIGPESVRRGADAALSGVCKPAAPVARAVIAEVHDDTRAARTMLEQEGFRYEGYVDIFDAGPTLECFPRRHPRRAQQHGAAGEPGRGRPGAGQPDRRHSLARLQPPVRRFSRDPRARAVAGRSLSAFALRRVGIGRDRRRFGPGRAAVAEGPMSGPCAHCVRLRRIPRRGTSLRLSCGLRPGVRSLPKDARCAAMRRRSCAH